MIKPLVVSSGFGVGFNSQFIWTGITFVEKPQIIIMMIFFTCGLEEREMWHPFIESDCLWMNRTRLFNVSFP